MARFLRPETAFFLVAWAAFLVLFRERAFYDPGALWHVKVGDLILAGGFMRTDPFTFTFAGHTWIPQQWGAEVLMAVLHRAGGFDALLVGFAALVAGLFTGVFARMRAAGMHWALAGVMAAGWLFPAAFHFFARPHMATIALLAWTMACLVDFDRGRATAARLAGLIPLSIVWTNLHGGVLGGIATLGLGVAGWGALFLVDAKRKTQNAKMEGKDPLSGPVRSWRTAGLLVAIVAACALTPFSNPFGMEMIRTWTRIVGSPVLKEVVNEHKPLDLTQTPDQLIAATAVGYLVVLAGAWPARPRVTWLLPLVWFALTMKGIRQGPLFVVTAAVAVADVWPHTVWHRLLVKYGDTFAQDPPADGGAGWRAFVLPAAAVLAALGLQAGGVEAPVVGRGWARLDPAYHPVGLTPVLREYARTAGPEPRIFNDANLGGYLILHVPELKIFMDDRFELYGDAWTAEYVDGYWYHPEKVDGWADRYGLDLALVVTGDEPSAVDKYLSASARWAEVPGTRSGCAVLFRRK